MIFRTGSVLIVGKCDENILYKVYNFIKDILMKEYNNIGINITEDSNKNQLSKFNKKRKKKYVMIEKI